MKSHFSQRLILENFMTQRAEVPKSCAAGPRRPTSQNVVSGQAKNFCADWPNTSSPFFA